MANAINSHRSAKRPRQIPMLMMLATAFTIVALVASVSYLLLLYGTAATTQRMLHDRTQRLVDDEVRSVRELLNPIVAEIELSSIIAGVPQEGRDSSDRLAEVLSLALIRMPGVVMAEFVRTDRHAHRVLRTPDGPAWRDESLQAEPSPKLLQGMSWRAETGVFWSPPLWSSEVGQPVIRVGMPIKGANAGFADALVATVALGELSERISESGNESNGGNFILVGHDKVLAHRRMVDPRGLGLSEQAPLPKINQVGAPALAAIWNKPAPSMWFEQDLHELGHVADVSGRRWLFVHRLVSGYGPEPWYIGRYLPVDEVTGPFQNLGTGALVGAATLIFAFLLAAVISFRVSRLIATITSAAKSMGRLDFDQVHYQSSRVREIDDAGYSLDRARAALKWFGAYVPKSLVARIMQAGEAALVSRTQMVTVLFTDIVHFSQITRGSPVGEVAAMLNQHFAILGTCIEREGGLIDKFIGDAAMATWGSLSGSDDQADSAVRAALAIVSALKADNATRRRAGKHPIRIRLGIHTGAVLVGNIGSPGRVNYTVVGDAVNIAQRLEQAGKDLMAAEDEVVVLVSADTVALLRDRTLADLFHGTPFSRFDEFGKELVSYFRLSHDQLRATQSGMQG
jgi:adenylate cyclase